MGDYGGAGADEVINNRRHPCEHDNRILPRRHLAMVANSVLAVKRGSHQSLIAQRPLRQASPSEATIMARRIVMVVVYRLASDHLPNRVGLAVLVELFARHEMARRARLETFVKLPQFVGQPAAERLCHLDLASGLVGVTDRSEGPAQLADQHGPDDRRIVVQLRLCHPHCHSPELSAGLSGLPSR
jgi:hypothetical protein